MLLRIEHIYIQFNCAKDYNLDAEVPNTVTLTHAVSDRSPSDRLAALSKGQSYVYNFGNSGTWTFQVCSIGNKDDEVTASVLSIHSSNSESACPQPVLHEPEAWSVVMDNAVRSGDGFRKFLGFLVLTSFVLISFVGIQACCDSLMCLFRRSTKYGPAKSLEKEPLSPSSGFGAA